MTPWRREINVTIVDFVEAWWPSVQGILEPLGVSAHFRRSPVDHADVGCHLLLRRGEAEAEVLAWASGMADFNILVPGGAHVIEHFEDARHPDVLGRLLSRLVAAVLR